MAIYRHGKAGNWKTVGAIALMAGFAIAFFGNRTLAQSNIVPDNTLGAESSVVVPNFNGLPVEAIGGGAQRGQNLFHSFQEFNVSEGRGAYFFSPNAAIQNILARVTGNNPSQILGTLGTFGDSTPNLFLINPNGIIFGQNASLDVGGSFVATTANAIRLGDTGLFSASEPQTSNLLSINPSAFFFNSLASQAQIVNRSTATTTVLDAPTSGLQVPDGRSLLLVGGDVMLNGGRLFAPGGRVELGGVQENGTVGLNANGNELRLSFPDDVARADVSLLNRSELDVVAGNGGSIAINARNIDILERSQLRAGIGSGQGSVDSQAGDIKLSATEAIGIGQSSRIRNDVNANAIGNSGNIQIRARSFSLTDDADLSASTFGQGNTGSIFVQADQAVSIANGSISSLVGFGLEGSSGDINIQAGSLSLSDTALLATSTLGKGDAGDIRVNAAESVVVKGRSWLSTATFGQGNAGNVAIQAGDTVSFDESRAISSVASVGRFVGDGNGGNISIEAQSLYLTNGSRLLANTFGRGDAGNVFVQATNSISLADTSRILSNVEGNAVGNGGDISIQTGSLSLTGGSDLQASTFGRGNAGNVTIKARDTLSLDGVDSDGFSGGVFSTVAKGAIGNNGNINIQAGSLFLSNGAVVNASTSGQGNGGNVAITVRDNISLDGVGSNEKSSGIFSNVCCEAVGKGGDINIQAGLLSLSNGAAVSASTFGRGNAGNVAIAVRDNLSLDSVGSHGFSSGVFSTVAKEAEGKGGDINIQAGSLSLTNGAAVNASTFGQGNAGNVAIAARETIFLDGVGSHGFSSGVFSTVAKGAAGNGGKINIQAGSLFLSNGAVVNASTSGQGNAGNVALATRDNISMDGVGSNASSSGIFSRVAKGAVGNNGNINIQAGSLFLSNGAVVSASTSGQGNGGNVALAVRDNLSLDGVGSNRESSGIYSSVCCEAVGKGGDIYIQAGSLSLTNGATVNASTFGQGNAGNIVIAVPENISLDGVGRYRFSSRIVSSVEEGAAGDGGDINVTARSLSLTNGALITSQSDGTGSAGDIIIQADQNLELNRSSIAATTRSGDGGDMTLQVGDLLLMRNNSLISTEAGTAQQGGDGGNIRINAAFVVAVPREDSDIVANAYEGRGGNINITTQGIFGLEFRENRTPLSDITASSELGVDGEVTVNGPDVDPSRGLAELPTNVVDATGLIDRRCTPRSTQERSSFTITGRGGLPPSPNDPLQGEAAIADWVTLDSEEENTNTATPEANPTSTMPKQLVEAQSWVLGSDMQVILTAEAPTVTPYKSWQTSPSCQDLEPTSN